MDNYNIGSGLTDINATSVTTDTLICDDMNSQSGIINFNTSSLSNIQNIYANNNVISANITSLSNSHVALSNSHVALSNSHMLLSNAHTTLSNTFVSYSNVSWKFNNSNVYIMSSSNVCIGTTNATQQLTLTGSIQASNLYTSNLIVYRNSNVLDTDGKIDYKWIKNAPIQDDGTGVIVIPIPVINNIYTNINPSIETDTGGNGNETYDPNSNSNAIYVHWRNVNYHPFYCRTGTDEQVAFGSNVFIEKNSKIYGVDSVDLIKTDAGRIRSLDTNLLNPTLFYDFANQEMFLKVINCNSNINASNIITSNITSSNSTFFNVFVQSNINSSNINSSNIYSSNFDTRILYATQSVLSNATLCNAFFTSNATVNFTLISSNINSSNIFASNIETRTFASSNGIFSNLSTNLLQATSVNCQTSIITTMTATTLSASNVSSCNVNTLSNNFHTFSNNAWKFNSNIVYHGLGTSNIAIGQSNATEKLDIIGNVKVSGGGSFANNNFVINSNPANLHCLTINNSNMFRTDGTIGNHFLSQLNILAGNQTFTGTAGDIFNPQTQSSNLLTNFNSVIWKPTYHDSNFNLGFSSNVFFNRFSQLCTTEPAWDYTKSNNGMYKTFNAPFVRSNVVIDFNTYTATLCNIFSSNATISNNIFTSNIIASNITTSNLISLNANLSNVWASNIGINQVNPLYNLDVNGGARIQRDLLVNSNVTCACNLTVGSNLGAGTTSPAYTLDVNGITAMRNGNANTGWARNQILFGYNNANTYQHAINTRHDGGGGNKNSIDFLLWNNNVSLTTVGNINPMSITATGVGIFNSNPSYQFDVVGDGLVRGTTAWNALGQQANLFLGDGFNKIAGEFGGGIVLQTFGTTKPFVVQNTTGNVGIGYSNPSYKLDINGTGLRLQGGTGATPTIFYLNSTGVGNTTSQVRFVNSGHHITCTDSNLYNGVNNIGGGHNIYYQSGGHNFSGRILANDGIQLSTNGTTLLGQKIVNFSVGMGTDGLNTYTVTHNLGTSSYNVFFSHEDTTTPVVDDVFLIKVLSKGTNTVNIGIARRTNAFWNRSWNLVCMFVVS